MSATANSEPADGRSPSPNGELRSGELVVVTVTESVLPALTGREGCSYISPPQPLEQAMTLVRLLLGRDPAGDECRWTMPIAGGRRLVTVSEEPVR